MIKRGDRKQFKEFVCYIKDNKHRYNQVRIKLNKLIEGNVDLNQKGYMGKTLLHIAVKLKDKKLMQMFINAGVYVDLADNNGTTPLHLAINSNRLDLVKILIDCTCENCGIRCCGNAMKEISAEEAQKLLENK